MDLMRRRWAMTQSFEGHNGSVAVRVLTVQHVTPRTSLMQVNTGALSLYQFECSFGKKKQTSPLRIFGLC